MQKILTLHQYASVHNTLFVAATNHPKDNINTAREIEKARDMLRTGGRPNAPKVMIIVTNGRSKCQVKTIAKELLAKVRFV